MATSNSVDFNQTTNEIIRDAAAKLGILAEGEELTAEQRSRALRDLNRLIRTWIAQGIHLWTYQEITLFLQKGKESYLLGPDGDHATANFVDTSLLFEAPLSNLPWELIGELWEDIDINWEDLGELDIPAIAVEDVTGISEGDYIGICLDTNDIFFTTVSAAPIGNLVPIAEELPSSAASGNRVVTYTNKTDRPVRIHSARRRDQADTANPIDVPMVKVERSTYFNLPNKKSQGLSTQFYYDRQLDNGVIYLWSAPSNCNNVINLTIERPLQDFDTPTNTADLPQEWLMALVYNLAVLMAPEYGVPLEDRRELKAEAGSLLELVKGFDQEMNSIKFQPGAEPQEGWE